MDLFPVLTYLAANCGAVIAGVIFWWTLENMQPLRDDKRKPEKLALIITLSIVFTPLGALVVSLVTRGRRLLQDTRQGSE